MRKTIPASFLRTKNPQTPGHNIVSPPEKPSESPPLPPVFSISPDSVGPMTSMTDIVRESARNYPIEVASPRSIAAVFAPETPESLGAASSGQRSSTSASSGASSRANDNANWPIARWKDLEEKRRSLQQKRVSLERRLFEPNSAPLSYLTPEARRFLIENKQVEWTGQVVNDLPSGYGRMLFQDGQIYEGHCVEGMRHGRGKNVWSNHQVFVGEWATNRRVRGTHSWPDGRTCTGSWSNGHMNGRVTFSWPDGSTYDGEALAGRQHGRGTQVWSDGRVYTGQYFEGFEHGIGTLTEPDQHSKYRGSFQKGKRHGQGVQIWGSMMYDGAWKEDQVHGLGLLTWTETGASYKGLFEEGLYHGHGCFQSGNGASDGYIGQWQNGMKSGVGKEYSSDGSVYEGDFVGGQKEGFGCMVFPCGKIYSGGWMNGNQQGQGMEIDQNGKILRCGFWGDETPTVMENGNATVVSAASDHSSDLESLFWD